MCMQCVSQATPFVGVALSMLNRRTLTSFATTTWRRATGSVPADEHDEHDEHDHDHEHHPERTGEARDGCR